VPLPATRGRRLGSEVTNRGPERSAGELAEKIDISASDGPTSTLRLGGTRDGDHEWWGDMGRCGGAAMDLGSAPRLMMREAPPVRARRAPARRCVACAGRPAVRIEAVRSAVSVNQEIVARTFFVSLQTHAQATPYHAAITGICGACRDVLESKLSTPGSLNSRSACRQPSSHCWSIPEGQAFGASPACSVIMLSAPFR